MPERNDFLNCPGCGAPFHVAGDLRGRRYRCEKCGMKLAVASEGGATHEAALHFPVGKGDLSESVDESLDDPQKRFGKYVLLRKVGEGGFSAVYKAYEMGLGRTVALKFVRVENPEDVQRFVREAQTAAKLAHPHIVPLHEVGEYEGRYYLKMEFLEGVTLAKLRVEPRRAIEVIRDVAGAVEYAHAKGIIHRDLKPQNLMMGDDGHVWVMDFGLARQLKGGTTLTVRGSVLGTPAYMPPEQAEGKPCDPRSDVYSLGATLYELVTGRPPFEGAEALAILDKVRSEDPVPPRRLNPGLDPEIETIVAKAMEKTPGRRYASVKAFAEDLRRHLAGEPILAKPSSLVTQAMKWLKRHRTVTAVGAVVLVGALALTAVLTVNALRFRREIRDLEARARKAEEGGRFREAAGLYREIRTFVPEHRAATEREAAAHAAERRAAVAEWIDKGRAAREDYENLRRKRDEKRWEAGRLEDEIPKYEGEAKKPPLWDALRDADDLDEKATLRYTDTLVLFTRALGVDPENAEARAALAEFYYGEYKEEEKYNNRREMKAKEKLVRLFGEERYGRELAWEGTLTLDSEPTGAEVELLRYEEAPDRRLVPKLVKALGACPIPKTRLEGGSYLLILRKRGYRDVRYPIFIERGTEGADTVNLYTDEEIGMDCLYVPGGPFIMGGDKEAYLAGARTQAQTNDFFLARCEVTCEEYLEFLNDRAYHDVGKAWGRAPRQSPLSGHYWEKTGQGIAMRSGEKKLPVWGISWGDADTYCAWLTKRAEGRGEKGICRLPTNVEWEKAARGVDGRFFPWGNHFDWSFTKGGESRPSRPAQMEPVGTFEKDESPYGVRDMAGSMREWCEDWQDANHLHKYVRGGAWGMLTVPAFRPATRFWIEPSRLFSSYGFRTARSPNPR